MLADLLLPSGLDLQLYGRRYVVGAERPPGSWPRSIFRCKLEVGSAAALAARRFVGQRSQAGGAAHPTAPLQARRLFFGRIVLVWGARRPRFVLGTTHHESPFPLPLIVSQRSALCKSESGIASECFSSREPAFIIGA